VQCGDATRYVPALGFRKATLGASGLDNEEAFRNKRMLTSMQDTARASDGSANTSRRIAARGDRGRTVVGRLGSMAGKRSCRFAGVWQHFTT